jgi:8-oxo-dGTP pyrophosphatase MutT (NUDIX family)
MLWKVHDRHAVYTSPWVEVWLEDVELPDGTRFKHHVLRMPRRSVAVVVLDDADRALLIWRHRFITDTWGWEVPAGWVDEGESPIDAGGREVEEETGWRPGPLHPLCSYRAVPCISDQHFSVFWTRTATYQGEPADGHEAARVEWVPLSRVRQLIEEGLLTDGPSVTALCYVVAFGPATR